MSVFDAVFFGIGGHFWLALGGRLSPGFDKGLLFTSQEDRLGAYTIRSIDNGPGDSNFGGLMAVRNLAPNPTTSSCAFDLIGLCHKPLTLTSNIGTARQHGLTPHANIIILGAPGSELRLAFNPRGLLGFELPNCF